MMYVKILHIHYILTYILNKFPLSYSILKITPKSEKSVQFLHNMNTVKLNVSVCVCACVYVCMYVCVCDGITYTHA